MSRSLRVAVAMLASSIAVTLLAGILLLHGTGGAALAAATEAPRAGLPDSSVTQWAVIAAAIAAGLSTLAAGYAVAMVGSAAVGAVAEKPELLGRVLLLVGLAEGIAIYGLIVAVLILNRAG